MRPDFARCPRPRACKAELPGKSRGRPTSTPHLTERLHGHAGTLHNCLQRSIDSGAMEPSLVSQNQAMAQQGQNELLHIVRHNEGATTQRCQRLGSMEERKARARTRAELNGLMSRVARLRATMYSATASDTCTLRADLARSRMSALS